MPKKIDRTGQRFGRLVVLYDTGERKNGSVIWHCRCDCGNEADIRSTGLISGNTKSCGCYHRERTIEANVTHGMTRQGGTHPAHRIWNGMLQRCENPNNPAYKDYGGRGIAVCPEWHDSQVFIEWALDNGWQKGLSIDRIDNNGNYEPSNCRWVTRKEQARNKRNNHFITFGSKTQCLTDWAIELEISKQALFYRTNELHWPIERALTESARGHTNAS